MESFIASANTSHKIKALLASKGMAADTLSPILDVHTVTIYNRMKNNSWSVDDINKIAEFHKIDPKDLI
jgi:hypothetical protein